MSESDGELSVGAPSPISPKHHYHLMTAASQNSRNGPGKGDVSLNHEPLHSSKGYQPERDQSTNDSNSSGSLTSRNPTCARCKNHNIISPLKGHKRYCPTRHCLCELCKITIKKQKVNAEQVATRRAQAQDEEMGLTKPNGSNNRPPTSSVSSPSITMSTRSISPPMRTSRTVLVEEQATLRNDPLRLTTYSTAVSPIRASIQHHQPPQHSQHQQQHQHQQQQKLPEAVEQQQLHEQLNQEEQQLEQQEEQQPQERLQTTQPIIKKVSEEKNVLWSLFYYSESRL